MISSQIY